MEKKKLFVGVASLITGILILLCICMVAPITEWYLVSQTMAWILMIISAFLIFIGMVVVVKEAERMGYLA